MELELELELELEMAPEHVSVSSWKKRLLCQGLPAAKGQLDG